MGGGIPEVQVSSQLEKGGGGETRAPETEEGAKHKEGEGCEIFRSAAIPWNGWSDTSPGWKSRGSQGLIGSKSLYSGYAQERESVE
jgi:hypothetical protein